MSDQRLCPNCGQVVDVDELAPMIHAPGLPACRACRVRVDVAGHHQSPSWADKVKHPQKVAEVAKRLAS